MTKHHMHMVYAKGWWTQAAVIMLMFHVDCQELGCGMMGGAGPPYCCCLYFGVNLEIPARYCSSSLIDDLPCFDSESLDQNIRSVYI